MNVVRLLPGNRGACWYSEGLTGYTVFLTEDFYDSVNQDFESNDLEKKYLKRNVLLNNSFQLNLFKCTNEV